MDCVGKSNYSQSSRAKRIQASPSEDLKTMPALVSLVALAPIASEKGDGRPNTTESGAGFCTFNSINPDSLEKTVP
jgi:hypothetical protein